jgi:hypothetical protein
MLTSLNLNETVFVVIFLFIDHFIVPVIKEESRMYWRRRNCYQGDALVTDVRHRFLCVFFIKLYDERNNQTKIIYTYIHLVTKL